MIPFACQGNHFIYDGYVRGTTLYTVVMSGEPLYIWWLCKTWSNTQFQCLFSLSCIWALLFPLEQVMDFLNMMVAGLAGSPQMMHCTILAITRIIFEYRQVSAPSMTILHFFKCTADKRCSRCALKIRIMLLCVLTIGIQYNLFSALNWRRKVWNMMQLFRQPMPRLPALY